MHCEIRVSHVPPVALAGACVFGDQQFLEMGIKNLGFTHPMTGYVHPAAHFALAPNREFIGRHRD
jgi:hypothetical protein